MRIHARTRAVAAALLVALGVVACGGGDSDDDRGSAGAEESSEGTDGGGEATSTTTTVPEATTTTLSPEDEVWQSVSEGHQAMSTLGAAPDPNAPELAQYYTGESLERLQGAVTDAIAGNETFQTTVELHRYSITIGGDVAEVDYCFIDRTQLLVGGQPSGPLDVASMRSRAQMQRIDGQWKMASATREEEQCPAE